MLELAIGGVFSMYIISRFGIIGMLACVIMQYIRTGLISVLSDWGDLMNIGQAWIFPPIFTIIGIIIGCV